MPTKSCEAASGSAAIDAGVNAGVTTDIDGDARPLGSTYDIGYDESPYTATFSLTVTTAGPGSGVVTPAVGVYTYATGTVITVTASANLYSIFSGWGGDCSGSGACVVTMTANRSVVANFNQYRIYLPLVAKNF